MLLLSVNIVTGVDALTTTGAGSSADKSPNSFKAMLQEFALHPTVALTLTNELSPLTSVRAPP